MPRTLRVLLVEDVEDDAVLVVRELQRAGFDVRSERVETRAQMEVALAGAPWDLVITDGSLPQFSAVEAVRLLHQTWLDVPCIVLSGTITEEAAVQVLKAGASDFIVKGNLARLAPAVLRELREADNRRGKQRAEEALRRTLQRLDIVLRTLPIGLYSVDHPAPGECTITWMSENTERICGFPAARFVADAELWVSRIHPDDRDRVLAEFHGDHREKPSSTAEYRWQRADGAWRWFLDHSRPVREPGAGAHQHLGVWIDVSDRKALEEQFLHAQKMEAVGRIAGGTAHDFNNILAVVIGYAEILAAALPAGTPSRGQAEEIRRAGERGAALTRQLLSFSRRQVVQPRVLDPDVVVAEMGGMLRSLLGEEVVLETRFAPGVGRVLADPGQVEQVVMNLAVNARDAMAGSGRCIIETGYVAPDDPRLPRGTPPGEWVMIAVTDTGSGMDEAVRARIFEPFFTTKEDGKGTGLGLATVQSIVDQSGGRIAVESAPGKGTTFRVFLPRTEEAAASRAPTRSGVEGGSETVLVVDDQAEVLQVTAELMRGLGYKVIEATGGAQALRAAEAHRGPLHLLLTDLAMPEMNGVVLLERMRAARPGIRGLFVSGYAGTVAPGTEIRVPAGVPFLAKPFSVQSLASKVREALGTPAPGMVTGPPGATGRPPG